MEKHPIEEADKWGIVLRHPGLLYTAIEGAMEEENSRPIKDWGKSSRFF